MGPSFKFDVSRLTTRTFIYRPTTMQHQVIREINAQPSHPTDKAFVT
jgi:hypothetical protein